MWEFSSQSTSTEDQGWAAPVVACDAPAIARKTSWIGCASKLWRTILMAGKCRRMIFTAAIGCFIGSIFWGATPLRLLAAMLSGLYLGAPRLASWLPGAGAGVSQVFHNWYLQIGRRRWLQFRLRELLVLVLVCGLILTGWNWISPYRKARREQDAFIAAVEALGGAVVSSTYGPSWYPVRAGHYIHFNGPLHDSDLAYLSTFPAAKSVISCDFSSSLVTDSGLAHLAQWSKMSSLFLNRSPITDQGIRAFARMKEGQLSDLWVQDCRGITDGSVDDLLRLAPQHLVVSGTSITLSGMTKLEAYVWPRLPAYESNPSNTRTSPTQGPGGSTDPQPHAASLDGHLLTASPNTTKAER